MPTTKINNQTQTRLTWKDPVKGMTDANQTLGSGLGSSATIGSVTYFPGDRILLTGQTTASENGIYTYDTSMLQWVRSLDADTDDDVISGMVTYVMAGAFAAQFWYLTTFNPITLGSTSLSFATITVSIGTGSITGAELQDNAVTGAKLDQRREDTTNPGSTWTLASTPYDSAHLQVYLNGVLLTPGGVDYSLSGADVAFTITPGSTDAVSAIYFI